MRLPLFAILVVGCGVTAHASVTAFTPASYGNAFHNSGLYSFTQSAPLFAWDAPYTTTSLLGGFWETRGRMTTSISTNTPTLLRMDGDYFGFAGITYSGSGLGSFFGGYVQASGDLNFTVDTPSVVTISSFNTAISTSSFGLLSAASTTGRLRFNGVDYIVNAADASFTINVGPGSYNAQFFADTSSLIFGDPNSQAFAQQSQKFRIQVESPVPEPGSLFAVGLGVATLATRRRRQ